MGWRPKDEQCSGLDDLLALFDNLPALTEQELKVDLPKVGGEVLAIQQADVAVLSGALRRALEVQVVRGGIAVRIGLIGWLARSRTAQRKAQRLKTDLYNLGPWFYGRIIEFGRAAQSVFVQRRRLVNGRLRLGRNRRKLREDLEAEYTMRVPALPARPFVSTPESEAAALDAGEELAAFWDAILSRGGST